MSQHLFYVVRVIGAIYLGRAGELHFLQVHLSAANYVCSDVCQLAPLFESKRTKAAAKSKGKASDAPDALRNRYLPEIAVKEAAPADFLQS